MKITYIITIFILFTHSLLYSQVGINTRSPNAILEIASTGTGIPALKLKPQTNPTGTADGQLAVINNMLCTYDLTRGKWLSVETTCLIYGKGGTVSDTQDLRWAGYQTGTGSGPLLPFKGTIVGVSIQSSGGYASKEFVLQLSGSDVADNNGDPTIDGVIATASNAFYSNEYNLDFPVGTVISTEVGTNGSGATVRNPVLLIWVKWRP